MAQSLSSRRALQLEFSLDTYLADLDAVDMSLGAHLIDVALTPGLSSRARRGSAAWWREQVVTWCGLASTAARFDPESVGSAAMAAEHMEDELLLPWIRSLISAGADVLLPSRPAA